MLNFETQKQSSEKPKTIDTIKSRFIEGLQGIKERAKEKIKTVAESWKEDVVGAIKLKTVDKLKLCLSSGKENFLISKKYYEVAGIESKTERKQEKIKGSQERSAEEQKNIQQDIERFKDMPDIMAAFVKAGEKKKEENQQLVASEKKSIDTLGITKQNHLDKINGFKENIDNSKKIFEGKIDTQINRTKKRFNYETLEQNKKSLGEKIKSFENISGQLTSRVADLEYTVSRLKELKQKDKVAEFKNKLSEARKQLKQSENSLNRAKGAHNKNEARLEKVNNKLQKYDDIKIKYGLKKPEFNDSNWEFLAQKAKNESEAQNEQSVPQKTEEKKPVEEKVSTPYSEETTNESMGETPVIFDSKIRNNVIDFWNKNKDKVIQEKASFEEFADMFDKLNEAWKQMYDIASKHGVPGYDMKAWQQKNKLIQIETRMKDLYTNKIKKAIEKIAA